MVDDEHLHRYTLLCLSLAEKSFDIRLARYIRLECNQIRRGAELTGRTVVVRCHFGSGRKKRFGRFEADS